MIGLRAQNTGVLKPYRAGIIKSMDDSYPPVAVTASAIAYNEFNHPATQEKLKQFSSGENIDIALRCSFIFSF